jgi:hypothetical protein
MSIQGPSPPRDTGAPTFITPPTQPSLPDAPPSIGVPAATATVSPWASLLNKLQHLQQSNPAAFKRVVGQMAEMVETDTHKAARPEAESLAKLSDELKQLAKTGDLTVFRPTHHQRHPRTQPSGSAPSLLQNLLEQIDHVLGPGATPPTP